MSRLWILWAWDSEGIAHGKSSLHLRSDAPTGNGEGSLTTDGWLSSVSMARAALAGDVCT